MRGCCQAAPAAVRFLTRPQPGETLPPRRETELRYGRLSPGEAAADRGRPAGQRCRAPRERRTRRRAATPGKLRGRGEAAAAGGSGSNAEREVMEAGLGRGVRARPGVG